MSGIYIHIPFCIQKCSYCDFYSITDLSLEDAFVSALINEITISAVPKRQPEKINTIYFGGGTPSALKPESIDAIIGAVFDNHDVEKHSEITIEVNPGTVTLSRLADYRKTGINRVNAGVQSFNTENLKFLNRIHSSDDAVKFIESARKNGFDNIGIDLIYCLPGQTEKLWLQDLETATLLMPEHLSCYILTYEEGTPLYSQYEKGIITPAGEVASSGLFKTTIDVLSSKGYQHYEISNFSSSADTRSRHNLKYWDFVSYRGFGPSAHSFDAGNNKRFWNTSDIFRYINQLSKSTLPVEDEEILTEEQKMIEALYLGFRKTAGIDIDHFNKRFETNFTALFDQTIRDLTDKGFLSIRKNHCRLTSTGILLADRISSVFIEKI